MLYFYGFFFLVLLLIVIAHVRYPLFFFHVGPQMWSVAVGKLEGNNQNVRPQVIISYEDAKKKSGVDYIADPFLMKKEKVYYLFVEAAIKNFGRIDVFSSSNFQSWKFEGVALEKEFHLSYPFVFQYKGQMYMIPEAEKSHEVTLYKAENFPLKWIEQRQLLKGRYFDTTFLKWGSEVYLFAIDRSYRLHCFYSSNLIDGEFVEHPYSPLGIGDKMRPAGRPVINENSITLPVQSQKKGYGSAVYSIIISQLTPSKIRYKKGKALLKPFRNHFYFSHGVHHIDIQNDESGKFFAIDGRVGSKISYFRSNWNQSILNNLNDIKSFFRILENNFFK